MALWKDNPPGPETAKPEQPAARPEPPAPRSTPRLSDIAAAAAQGGLATRPAANAPAQVAANAPAQVQAPTQAPTVRYVDRPECEETFADSVTQVYFDGQTLRLELCVTRLDELKPNTPTTGRRYPVQRLVLTPNAAVELINRMQQVANALTQAGVLKSSGPQKP
jgi:hypothetical protein